MSRGFLACGLALLLTGRAFADPAVLVPVRLVVRPREAPEPALRYRLLPALWEQKPGDAAPLYKEAADALTKMERENPDKAVADALLTHLHDRTPDDLPRAEVRRFLQSYEGLLRTVDRAARC